MDVEQGREMCPANVFFARSIEATSNIAWGEGLTSLQQESVVFSVQFIHCFSSSIKAVVNIPCDVS